MSALDSLDIMPDDSASAIGAFAERASRAVRARPKRQQEAVGAGLQRLMEDGDDDESSSNTEADTDPSATVPTTSVGAVRTHFLEIGAESMAGEPNEPVLERGAALGVERQPESIDINGMLKLIHGAV